MEDFCCVGQVTGACEATGAAITNSFATELDNYALHESKRKETETCKPR